MVYVLVLAFVIPNKKLDNQLLKARVFHFFEVETPDSFFVKNVKWMQWYHWVSVMGDGIFQQNMESIKNHRKLLEFLRISSRLFDKIG